MSTAVPTAPLARAGGRTSASRGTRARWGATLRLARRELLWAKGRALLVVALIAVPVAAMVFGEVMIRSINLTDRERALVGLGSVADARVDIFGSDAASLAAGADSLADVEHTDVVEAYYERVKVGGAFRYVGLTVADLASPLLRGAYDLTAGTAPLTADEAAVSSELAAHYHVAVGDRVSLRRSGQTWTVTGVYRQADQFDSVSVTVPQPPLGELPATRSIHRFLRAPASRLSALPQAGFTMVTRDQSASPPWVTRSDSTRQLAFVSLYTIGTIGLAIVGIVVSAAFAAGARRQLRTLGLAAASGGSPADIRRAVIAQGFVTGAVGVVAGFGLGAIGVAAMAPHLDGYANFVVPGLHTNALDLGIIGALAIVTAMLAAAVPAVGVGRAPVLVALAGRRPLAPLRNSVPAIGLVLFAVGLVGLGATARAALGDTGSSLAYTGSVLAMLIGAVLSTPWLVGRLDVVATRLRGPARLAARSMTRSRSRTGPITSAILVTVGAAAFVATQDAALATSSQNRDVDRNTVTLSATTNPQEGSSATDAVPSTAVGKVTAIVSGATHYGYTYLADRADQLDSFEPSWSATTPDLTRSVHQKPGTDGTLVTSDRSSLAAVGVPAASIAAWERGPVLVFGPGIVTDGRVTFGKFDRQATGTAPGQAPPVVDGRTIDAIELPVLIPNDRFGVGALTCEGGSCHTFQPPPLVVLPGTVAQGLSLTGADAIVIVRSARPLTAHQREQLRNLRSDLSDDERLAVERGADDTSINVGFVDDASTNRLFQLLLVLAATGAALGVTAIGLALSAAEGRADDATLLALGAPPRLRRSLRAWEALMTSGIGAVIGVLLGAAAGAVFAVQRNRHNGNGTDLRFPWSAAVGLGIGLPIVAAIIFWLATWPRRAVLLRDD